MPSFHFVAARLPRALCSITYNFINSGNKCKTICKTGHF